MRNPIALKCSQLYNFRFDVISSFLGINAIDRGASFFHHIELIDLFTKE